LCFKSQKRKKKKKRTIYTMRQGQGSHLKSSIPIGAKVEISFMGFLHLGVKTEIEKNLFNLPQVTNKC
jgi:hypothetical protein